MQEPQTVQQPKRIRTIEVQTSNVGHAPKMPTANTLSQHKSDAHEVDFQTPEAMHDEAEEGMEEEEESEEEGEADVKNVSAVLTVPQVCIRVVKVHVTHM